MCMSAILCPYADKSLYLRQDFNLIQTNARYIRSAAHNAIDRHPAKDFY